MAMETVGAFVIGKGRNAEKRAEASQKGRAEKSPEDVPGGRLARLQSRAGRGRVFFQPGPTVLLDFFNSNIYSIIAGISLAINLIINWKQLFRWGSLSSRPGAREFRGLLASLTVFFVTDLFWGWLDYLHLRGILYANTLAFFLSMALSVYFWARFTVAYLEMDGWSRARMLWVGRCILAFFVGALVVNVFNGKFFTIDANGVYSAGPLRQGAFMLLALFNVYGAIGTIVMIPRTKGSVRRHNKMLCAIGVTMSAAILFQLADPFLPLYGLGALFSLCLLHVFVVEDEREEMHRRELVARDYEAQLETERKANRAKSLFFSTVSHDIRTPLNAIIGYSELLEAGVDDGAERVRCVSSIRASAKVLARLVDDILDLSKLESGKLEILEEPTDVPALVREVIAACEVARAHKSLALHAEIGEMPWVSVDPQRLRQILFNLLGNAYKYTAYGTISVRVRWEDGTLSLSVADTGKGISKENVERILQPFVQVADRNHRDGTGLGLPICQKLARLMGGELTVESEPGAGSTFTVTLRNVKTAEPPSRSAGKDGQSGAAAETERQPTRVLVVDDSSVNRSVLKAMLAKIGVTDVTTAENGRKALEWLRGGEKAFDLVLTDFWMPEMDGSGLVHAIRADANLVRLPVYLVTADVEARKETEADGFTGVLLKPITLAKLRALFS
jgi:signal transduction histidine kinase